jgi:hypothetical protein
MRPGWSLFFGLAIPMSLLMLWAIRDAPLEFTQRAFLLAAAVATAAISAWLLSRIE